MKGVLFMLGVVGVAITGALATPESLADLLHALNLDDHAQAFEDHGFTSIHDIALLKRDTVSVNYLKELGLNSVQQLKVLQASEELSHKGLESMCRELNPAMATAALEPVKRRTTTAPQGTGDASMWLKALAAKICFGPDCDTSIFRTATGILSTAGLQLGAVDDARCSGAADAGPSPILQSTLDALLFTAMACVLISAHCSANP